MDLRTKVLLSEWEDYALLDCGGRRKLERFGGQILVRGEPKAWWHAQLKLPKWREAVAEISDAGLAWKTQATAQRCWQLRYDNLVFEARLTDMSKHVGIFPEQEPHWRWLKEKLPQAAHRLGERTAAEGKRLRVLNLFGYTGAATLVAAATGAEVTHVDASKPALAWARRNQELSGMGDAPIRWLLDDAFKFVAREIRRGRQYDVVLLDPPSFGRGPKGEIWKVESQIATLLEGISQLLNKGRGIVVLTLYNLEASPLMLRSLMLDYFKGGHLEFGELAHRCTDSQAILPLSLFARWDGVNA